MVSKGKNSKAKPKAGMRAGRKPSKASMKKRKKTATGRNNPHRATKRKGKIGQASMKKKKISARRTTVKMARKKPSNIPIQKKADAMETGEKKPKCLVLAGFGLNSEAELAHAFFLAGADAKIVHFSDISSGKKKLSDYQIFAIPGGWSFADDIAGGRVLANKLRSTFRSQFLEFVSSGKPVIGICNGFQVLVKLGALPNLSLSFSQEATLTSNASGKFEDRWVFLKPQKSACKYLEGVPFIHCPVRHAEGRLVADEKLLDSLGKSGLVVLKYVDENMKEAGYPWNPNGSARGIAGICNSAGNVFGLMPHPECSVRKVTYPRWTSGISFEQHSLRFFENVVKAARKFV